MAQKTYKYDVIIIGGGPNGLTCGVYLTRAGQKVVIVDRRGELGGGLATEEATTCAGFLHNVHAVYMMMIDYAPAYKDLELEGQYNLKHVYPSLQFAMPFSDGECLCLYTDLEKTCNSLARFSKRDAESYRKVFHQAKKLTEEFLAPATYLPPIPALEQVPKLEKTEVGRAIMDYSEKSPKKIIEELFENERVKTMMLYLVCMWGLDPEQEGVGYMVPLYLNRATNYRLCVGGSHSLTQALNKSFVENGGNVISPRRIVKIITEDGRARGIQLEDGTILEAKKAVVSTIDQHQTFLQLVGEEKLEKDFVESIKVWKWEHWSLLGIHMALDSAPNFMASKANPDINSAFVYILGYETPGDFINHYKAILKGEIGDKIGFNCCFPSIHDPSQAPEGRHTGLISQMAPYSLKGDPKNWYPIKFREGQAQKSLDVLRKYAPNLTDDVIRAIYISTPMDVENKFNDMVEGSIKQGECHPLQMGYNRPNPECSRNRSPIEGLYMGGACVYPGGTILLGGGYLAAAAVCEDLGLKKWWSEPEFIKKARANGMV